MKAHVMPEELISDKVWLELKRVGFNVLEPMTIQYHPGPGTVIFTQKDQNDLDEPPSCPICDTVVFTGKCNGCGFDESEKPTKG